MTQVAGDDSEDAAALALANCLASGLDPRPSLAPLRGLQGYGCGGAAVVDFGSTTAMAISPRGFAAAGRAYRDLEEYARDEGAAAAGDRAAESLRDLLRAELGLAPEEADIVFSPSGTDSQVHALYAAQVMLGAPLVSVVAAADETGSGTAYTAAGRHFNACTAGGARVARGAPIAGLSVLDPVFIPVRSPEGELRSPATIDREVCAAAAGALAFGARVVVHAMDSSKFGSRCPSLAALEEIEETGALGAIGALGAARGGAVQVVVDACQMRLGRRRLQMYLRRGWMVLITGSKFFSGPALSGALIVPPAVAARLAHTATPAGLRLYSCRQDWPPAWLGIRAGLPSRPNVGQLLRWAAAVEELRTYYTVPGADRAATLRGFAAAMHRALARRPYFHLLSTWPEDGGAALLDDEMSVRTIFPFLVEHRGRYLSVAACDRIYRAMSADLSLLPLAPPQRVIAARGCHIGQPVAVRHPRWGVVGALRIAASARTVSDACYGARPVETEDARLAAVLDKIDLLAATHGLHRLELPSHEPRSHELRSHEHRPAFHPPRRHAVHGATVQNGL
ncbi:MAG TPA: hypothetical protein VNE83_00265 [Terriglobales bacterium]|nr:hypothetical protein [Terriglobales bacterium]